MFPIEIKAAKEMLQGKISSLRNDSLRALIPLESQQIQIAPFPIIMYSMSVLDLISSLEVGWSEGNGKDKKQTIRLERFLHKRMRYSVKASKVLVRFHRHQLMHTSEPRKIKDKKNKDVYGWSIEDRSLRHMALVKITTPKGFSNIRDLRFGVINFIDDLESATNNYILKLEKSRIFQKRYARCRQEIEIKELSI